MSYTADQGKVIPNGTNVTEDMLRTFKQIGMAAGSLATGALAGLSTYYGAQGRYNTLVNMTLVTWTVWKYYLGNQLPTNPSAVIAGIPLGTVKELSSAISDRIVRYRARGGIFLAHQDGGNESLRIVGRAWGPNRYIFLAFLQFLFAYGGQLILSKRAGIDAVKATYEFNKNINSGFYLKELEQLALESNEWAPFFLDNLDIGVDEEHFVFPVVTKNRIFTSMYIESFQTDESTTIGQDIVEYTIFFRKAEPRTNYEYTFVRYSDPSKPGGFSYVAAYRKTFINKKNSSLVIEGAGYLDLLTSITLKAHEEFK